LKEFIVDSEAVVVSEPPVVSELFEPHATSTTTSAIAIREWFFFIGVLLVMIYDNV
jgi:hypothetical protein